MCSYTDKTARLLLLYPQPCVKFTVKARIRKKNCLTITLSILHIETAVSHIFADEKRRTVADFRDSSFNQTKETLCVSVKVLSALYLSKVAPQEPTHSPSKQVNTCLLIMCALLFFQSKVYIVNILGVA